MYRFFVDITQPLTVCFLLTAVGLALLWRKRVESRRRLLWVTIPFTLLFLVSTPAVSYLALRTVEWPYTPATERPPAAALVVLSGWAHRPNSTRAETVLGIDTQFRCIEAARLYRLGSPCTVVVAGGKVKEDDVGDTLGALMRDYLVEMDVPAEQILVEGKSRNTYENAVETAAMLRERGINHVMLVTAASHLPRAIRTFEAQGLTVTPGACEFQAVDFNWALVTFLPTPDGAAGFQRAFHEWLGLVVYWVTGRM